MLHHIDSSIHAFLNRKGKFVSVFFTIGTATQELLEYVGETLAKNLASKSISSSNLYKIDGILSIWINGMRGNHTNEPV